jgi:hypothetical protein
MKDNLKTYFKTLNQRFITRFQSVNLVFACTETIYRVFWQAFYFFTIYTNINYLKTPGVQDSVNLLLAAALRSFRQDDNLEKVEKCYKNMFNNNVRIRIFVVNLNILIRVHSQYLTVSYEC